MILTDGMLEDPNASPLRLGSDQDVDEGVLEGPGVSYRYRFGHI